MTAFEKIRDGLWTFASDIAEGIFEITHNGFALLGVVVVFVAAAFAFKPELRNLGEVQLISWLQARQADAIGIVADLTGIERATATDPRELPKQQAALAYWLSKKYRVAPEPISALVAESFDLAAKHKLDPTLILAVMAVESGFNPFAQSPVGAQGLMQVMTKVHAEKYGLFGGKFAAFDPVSNLRVGVKVLQDCITRGGSVEGGLRLYVGAGPESEDGGYVEKVLAEHERLRQVAAGQKVPLAARSPNPPAPPPS
jgi:soluble lytic murein transglycosylase-like protein